MDMPGTHLTKGDWRIRLHIYQFFADEARPPAADEIAGQLGIPAIEVRAAYHRLHDSHQIFLEPGTDEIRMANPLSAVPTPFRVTANGRDYYANCAWDSLGIPAMLGTDATIEASYTGVDEPAHYSITAGEPHGDDGVVHFPLPFRRWYEDLVHT